MVNEPLTILLAEDDEGHARRARGDHRRGGRGLEAVQPGRVHRAIEFMVVQSIKEGEIGPARVAEKLRRPEDSRLDLIEGCSGLEAAGRGSSGRCCAPR